MCQLFCINMNIVYNKVSIFVFEIKQDRTRWNNLNMSVESPWSGY